MTEKATTKQKTIVQNGVLIEKNKSLAFVLYSFKETAGDVTDNGEHATDLTDVLDRDEAEIVTITEELTEVKDDISALNSVKDEFVNPISTGGRQICPPPIRKTKNALNIANKQVPTMSDF